MKALFSTKDLKILKNHRNKIGRNILLDEVRKLIQNTQNPSQYQRSVYHQWMGFTKVIIIDEDL